MESLTERSVLQIRQMFLEPDLLNSVIDQDSHTVFSRIDIDDQKCEIVLGKTKYNWWNHLCGDIKKISLKEFVSTAIAVLSAKAELEKDKNIIQEGLLKESFDSLHRLGKTNDIIDRLFLIGYVTVKTAWSCVSLGTQGGFGTQTSEVNVNLHGKNYKKRFRFPGVGDAHLEVEFSPTDVRVTGRSSGDDYLKYKRLRLISRDRSLKIFLKETRHIREE